MNRFRFQTLRTLISRLLIGNCLLLIANCEAATVVFTVTNWNGTTPSNYIRLSQLTSPAITTNAVTIGPPKVIYPVNGIVTTNMLAGNYRLEIQGVPNTVPITFTVPEGSGTYQATDLILQSVVIPGPTLGYTQAAADSRFVIRSNAVLTGTTNQIVFGGTNTAPVNTATPFTWISIQVTGATNVFRLPIYQ